MMAQTLHRAMHFKGDLSLVVSWLVSTKFLVPVHSLRHGVVAVSFATWISEDSPGKSFPGMIERGNYGARPQMTIISCSSTVTQYQT